MGILSWDKPAQVMTKDEWSSISADSAPAGVYTPNMSREDSKKWKARKVGFKSGHPQIEIRREAMVIVVSLGGGYKYKFYTPDKTKGINVHISQSGAAQITFKEFDQMVEAILEAQDVLEET